MDKALHFVGPFSFPLSIVVTRPHIGVMDKIRYILLLGLVISAGGLTVLVAGLAAANGKLNGRTAMVLLPLVMLASIALRALRPDNKD
ncbi:hypothetical protein O2N63_12735 [Aliiroseovarius sp. KMU-50]|uniref:Uncharacterized protein n=1 Tax=Aliiroseovarius salicola TaxID=3009082 RepID=A0ABT4W556_9RHOB|nr:hypothetical protein [Aliiroseovarius sp. KMU-50]MDA5094952.1 hypothetical protein [Aliiroseovarius sp. KMU-50]